MNFSAPVKITDVYLICCCYVHVPRCVDLYLQLFANKKKSHTYEIIFFHTWQHYASVGGGMISETHQCYSPINSMRLCVLRCRNHMRSAP